MQDGTIGKQEGNKALSQINGMVGQFKSQAKYLAEIAPAIAVLTFVK